MFKNNSKILMLFGFAPFIFWLIIYSKGFFSLYPIITGILFFILGYGVSSSDKKWVTASIISLIVCCIYLFIMGLRSEYFKHIYCYIAVGIGIYYVTLHFFNYKLNK